MKRLRVLHILNTGSYSGAENVVITMIRNMRDSIDAIYLSKDGAIGQVLEDNQIAFYPVEKLSRKNLRRAIKDIQPDVIHAHDFTAGIMSVLSTSKVPVINHLHNNSPWIKSWSLKTIAYAISCLRYSSILTVSASIMDEFVCGKFFKKKNIIVSNPIDEERILELAEQAELKNESDIVFLGRLDKAKNPLLFIEIIKELKTKIPDIKVSMIGDGGLRTEVKARIKEYALEKNIVLYGFQANPYGVLAAGKILCIPSLWEGFGLVAVEAFTLGKPVVASAVGGLLHIVNPDCGMLCMEEQEYTEALYKFLTDEEEYIKKSKNALQRAKEFHNISEYTIIMKEIYKTVVKTSRDK